MEAGQFFQPTTRPRHPYLATGFVLLGVGLFFVYFAVDFAAECPGSSTGGCAGDWYPYTVAGIGFGLLGAIITIFGIVLVLARRRLWSIRAGERSCPSCGANNLPVSRFCHQCGKPLTPGVPERK